MSFFPASFPASFSAATGAFSTTAIGVYNPYLLCCSAALRAPLSTSCLRTSLATDPTTLYFSMTWETEMCFPILGIPWTRRSWVALSRKTAWSTFSLAFPLVHFYVRYYAYFVSTFLLSGSLCNLIFWFLLPCGWLFTLNQYLFTIEEQLNK